MKTSLFLHNRMRSNLTRLRPRLGVATLLWIWLLCVWIISVQALYAADVVLGWDQTVSRMDGTPLSSPATYRVYYGTHSDQYDHIVEVGTNNIVLVSGLAERVTYYFAVTASDDLGLESPPSEELAWNSFTADFPLLPSWLSQYGITNRAEDILEQDDDGDEIPVWQEYIMDTDPTDPDSHLRLMTMGRYVMYWSCSTNRIYDVQYSLDLVDGTWAPMDGLTDIVPSSREMVITNLFVDEATMMLRLVVRHP